MASERGKGILFTNYQTKNLPLDVGQLRTQPAKQARGVGLA
jgi:hypothetical protein